MDFSFINTASLFIFILQLYLIDCLKIKSIYVPKAITIGDSAWLNCSYELENDSLYSITWFKSSFHEMDPNKKKQFYRYVHNEIPPITIYETPGVFIDQTKSNLGSVYLYKSDLTTEGRYICEVLADQPSFQTVTRSDDMRVHYLPESGPTIEPAEATIGNVDFINVTCKSGPSKPKARLSWYINDQLAPKQYVYDEDYLSNDNEAGLRSSRLRLLLPVYQQHQSNDNYYRLRCESQFVQSFSEATQIVIKPESPRSNDKFIAGVLRPSSGRSNLVESVKPSNESIINKEGDLRVDGLKASYRTNDRVNLTCRSGNSRVHSTPSKLTWFINNVEATREMVQNYPIDSLGNSASGLAFTLSRSFLDKWSSYNDSKRSKLVLRCYALYEEILFQSSKEQTIRRYARESKSESAAVNTADQVTMGSGSSSLTGNTINLSLFIIGLTLWIVAL